MDKIKINSKIERYTILFIVFISICYAVYFSFLNNTTDQLLSFILGSIWFVILNQNEHEKLMFIKLTKN